MKHEARSVNVVQVIRVVSTTGGDTEKDDPFREIVSYWSSAGELLAVHDPFVPVPAPIDVHA